MAKTAEERFNEEYGGSEWESAGNYDAIIFDFDEPGRAFFGTYRRTKFDIGKHSSQLHLLENEGVTYGIWGSCQLDDIMADLKSNDRVAILYMGREKNPKTGMSFKSFKVKVKRSSEPLPSESEDDVPF